MKDFMHAAKDGPPIGAESATSRIRDSMALKALLMLAVLALFFVAISLMGGALKILATGTVKDLLEQATANPIVGLLLGVLTTSIIQSSSTTTTIVVAFTASGTISLTSAVPIVMGANIGTTITNTLVSLTHIGRRQEFQRALAAGTVHDFFNILAVCVLFPIEVATGFIQNAAGRVQHAIVGADFGEVSGLKDLINPLVNGLLEWLGPIMSLVLSLILLIVSLTLMVKIMRAIFINKMAKVLDRFLFKNAFTAFVVGAVFTVMVQSSSVTTSLVVPLVGAGILTLRQIFPYTLGANIGTTITAFLAALAIAATADPGMASTAGLGLTVALVHLLFNVFGIVIIYPFRAVPIWFATQLGIFVTGSRTRAVLFLVAYFLMYCGPLVYFLLI